MSSERKRVKRLVPFLEAHEYMYGVRVVERDPISREVTSVLCMFCAAFGREDDPLPSLRRRARTQKPKYWGGPTFRTDNYKSHFKKQHPIRWEQYQDLPPEQKQRYFDGVPALPKKQEKPRRSLDNEQDAVKTAPLRPPIVTPSEPEIAVSDATILAPASPESATVSSTQSPVAVAVTSVVQAPAAASVELDEGEVLAFLLDRDAVEVALGDVLFRAEDAVNGVGKQLAVFESTLDERDTLDQQKSDGTAEVALVVGSIAIKARWGLEGGYATLMSQQPQRISMLCLALAGDLGVEGPLPAYQRAALRDQSSLGEMIGSNDGMFAVKPHTIVAFVRGMGSWAAELFDELDAQERQKMIVSTADRTLDLVQGLHSLAEELEEHGSSKTSLSAFPPVLPHQVALLNPVDFQEIVRVYRPRVTETFSDAKLAAVETQHQELRTAASEAATRQLLAKSAENSASSFNQSWEALRARWGLLADFCGGLATVFPSSNGGSSGKTFVAVDATGSQRKLADFPLEARLQCQQFAELHANSDDDFRDGIQ
ncbi:hypothetical protein PI124_g1570 [Phytophthora idaei]|nr:hypothetical protein PI124_g1570 [Phytophthora idaei]